MFKKLVSVLVLIWFLLLPTAWGANTPNESVQTISATATNTAVSLTFQASVILIINDGPNSVFVTVAGTVSTTSKLEIKSGQTLSLTLKYPTDSFGFICNTAQTATVRFGAWG